MAVVSRRQLSAHTAQPLSDAVRALLPPMAAPQPARGETPPDAAADATVSGASGSAARLWPAVGFVNRLSGGQTGAKVFAAAKTSGLDVVHDLSEGGPRAPLAALAADPATAEGALLLCFGGDGTFNWVASTVLALRAEGYPRFHPDLVPCPLGTGNDLARSLGWGARFPGFAALPRFVADARAAPHGAELDVWDVGLAKSKAPMACMQNYFSVGVDAEVSRRFDAARSANPAAFRSQTSNKLRYATMGAGLAFRGAASLDKRVVLRIDGAEVPLPHATKSVLLLNIPSYGAGTHPWGDDVAALPCVPRAHHVRRFAPAAVDDGQLEVIALFGIVHAATLHNPLSWRRARGGGAKRLGQGSRVELAFHDAAALGAGSKAARKVAARPALAAQTDGEAWSFDSVGESITLTAAGAVGAPPGPAHRLRGWPHARFGRPAGAPPQPGDAAAQQRAEDDPRRNTEIEGRRREPYV